MVYMHVGQEVMLIVISHGALMVMQLVPRGIVHVGGDNYRPYT